MRDCQGVVFCNLLVPSAQWKSQFLLRSVPMHIRPSSFGGFGARFFRHNRSCQKVQCTQLGLSQKITRGWTLILSRPPPSLFKTLGVKMLRSNTHHPHSSFSQTPPCKDVVRGTPLSVNFWNNHWVKCFITNCYTHKNVHNYAFANYVSAQ